MRFLRRCREQFYFHRYYYWGESNDKGSPVLRGDGWKWDSNGMDTLYRHVCGKCGKLKWKR